MLLHKREMRKARKRRAFINARIRDSVVFMRGGYSVARHGLWWYVYEIGRRGYLVPVAEQLATRRAAEHRIDDLLACTGAGA